MANELPLGIKFSERDVDTRGIIAGVQKAINKAIAQVDVNNLKKRLATLNLKISNLLPKRITDAVTTRMNQALNRAVVKFDERRIKTAPLIAKVKRAIDIGVKRSTLAPLIAKFRAAQENITGILRRSIENIAATPAFINLKVDTVQLRTALRELSARRDLVVTVRAKLIPDRASLAEIRKQLGLAATVSTGDIQTQKQSLEQLTIAAKEYGISVEQAQRLAQSSTGRTIQTQQSLVSQSQRLAQAGRSAFGGLATSAENADRQISRMAVGLGRAARQAKILESQSTTLTRKQQELVTLFKDAGIGATEFGAKLGQIGKRFTAFFAYTIGVFKMIEATRKLIEEVRRLDDTVVSLAKVLPQVDTEQLTDRLVRLADVTGRTFEEASEAAIGFARAGLKEVDDIAKATEASLRLLNISTVDTATSFKLMITIANAFGVGFDEAAQKVAIFSEFADNAAVTVEDLAQGFIRGGAAANAAGLSVEEFGAVVATVTGTTQISATRIGTAFKTMLSRILRNRDAILDTVRITLRLDKTTLQLSRELDTTQKIILAMGDAWQKMNAQQKASFAQVAVGSRRLTELSAILSSTAQFTDQLGRVNIAAATALRKEALEATTVAAANRQVLRSVTELAAVIRDTGLVELYKDAAIAVGQTLGVLGRVVNLTHNWADSLKAVSSEDVGAPMALFSAGLGEVIDGVGLLRRTFLVLFAKILLPSIQKAIAGFTQFIRGSDVGINKLIAEQGNLNAKAFELVDVQGRAISKQNELTQAVKKTTAAYKEQQQQQATGAFPTFQAVGRGVTAGARGAIDVAKSVKDSVLNPLETIKRGAQGLGIGFKKVGQGIKRGFEFVTRPIDGFGAQMVRTTATMTIFDAASATAARAAEDLAKSGNETLATIAKLGSSATGAAASLIPFGTKAALAGAAIATIPQSIEAVVNAVKTKIESDRIFAEAAAEQIKLVEAISLAQRPGAEGLKEALVQRGLAEEVELEGRLTLRVPRGVSTREIINISQIRRQAINPLERALFNLQKEAVKVGDALAEGVEESIDKSRIVEKFRSTILEIQKEKIGLEFEFVAENFIAIADEFDNLILTAKTFEDSPIRLNIPDAPLVQGLAQELLRAQEALKGLAEGRPAAEVIKFIADESAVISDQINFVRAGFQGASDDADEVAKRIGEAGTQLDAAKKDSQAFVSALVQTVDHSRNIVKSEKERLTASEKSLKTLQKTNLARDVLGELQKGEEKIRKEARRTRALETLELAKQLELTKARAAISARQLNINLQQIDDFVQLNRLQVENAALAARTNDPYLRVLGTIQSINAENAIQQRQLEQLRELEATRIAQAKEQLRFVEETDVKQIIAGIEAEFKLKEAEINKSIIENTFKRIQAQIELEAAAEKERIDIVLNGIEQIKDDELERLDILKSLSDVIVQEDFSRFIQGFQSLQNIETGVFVQKSEELRTALSRMEEGLSATSRSLFDGGFIQQQLEVIGTDISNALGRQQSVQLAFALQRIDVERDAEEERLSIEKERAQTSIQQAKIEHDLRINEQRRQKEKSIALARETANGVENAFGRVTDAMNEIIATTAEIDKVDKEIRKLRASLEFLAPEDLTRQAGRLDSLQQQREATAVRLEEVQAFQAQIRAGFEMADALSTASVQGAKFIQSVKFQVGAFDSFSKVLSSLTAAYNSFSSNLVTSEQHVFELRAQLARDAVSVLKSQFDAVKGFGQRLFTASFGQLNELSRAAQFLGRDAADVPIALRDAFTELLKLTKGGPAAELDIAIAGLERVGLDSSELERLQSQIIRQAEEAARNDLLALEAQQKTAESSASTAVVLQRQLNLMDKDIKAAEEAKNRIEELKEEYIRNRTEITKTDQQQLQEARERKKFLSSQLSLHGKEYQLNSQRYSQLIALSRETAGATVSQSTDFSQLVQGNTAVQESVTRFTQIAEESKAIQELMKQDITTLQEVMSATAAAITDKFTPEQLQGAMTTALKADSTKAAFGGAINNEDVLTNATFTTGLQTLNTANQNIQAAIVDGDMIALQAINSTTTAVNTSTGTIAGAISAMQTSIVRAVNNIQIKVQKIVQAPTSAAGLSTPEMHGIISAARREKSRMPMNSDLIVANSSELVMRPEQARKLFGQVQAPESAREITRAPLMQQRRTVEEKKTPQQSENVNRLLNKLEELIDKAENKDLFKKTQEVKINVGGKKDIQVRGLEGISKRVREAFEDEMSKVASKAETNLINARIDDIVRRLKMAGLDGVI
jgi:TP901 family phage tail tape measure protein